MVKRLFRNMSDMELFLNRRENSNKKDVKKQRPCYILMTHLRKLLS